jgi:squalene-hopene/tetraprenyl-beta-curcumene cyclase
MIGTATALFMMLTVQTPPEGKGLRPNSPKEPIAKEFSIERGREFLDSASLWWQKEKNCLTCHTNVAYLSTGAVYASKRPAFEAVRQFFEDTVSIRWEESKGPRYQADVLVAAQGLAISDAETTGKLHPLTRRALDRMWTLQRPDGGWNWEKCDWAPLESDDQYGVTVAIMAALRAPENYADTPAAQEGLKRARAYLKNNPPTMLHHRAMLLWVSKYADGFVCEADKERTLTDLLALQRPDGGWATSTLGQWKRTDGKEQDLETSDGYGTGFVIYQARLSGIPASDERLQKGVAWLKTHQRESGRWFTRSLSTDSKHYLTNVGTAFALLALHECGETGTR